jgi:hypothetical protein
VEKGEYSLPQSVLHRLHIPLGWDQPDPFRLTGGFLAEALAQPTLIFLIALLETIRGHSRAFTFAGPGSIR